MNFKKLRTIALGIVAAAATQTQAQDLLARQAPVDEKMNLIESIALNRQLIKERSEFPAMDLYPEWSNQYVHIGYKNIAIPDTFRIDLTGFCMPTDNRKITSKFGPRRRRMHNGLDVKVYVGDTIRAAFDGRVRMVKYERRGYGKYVVIRHDNGLETVYGHLSKQLVEEDEYVKAGDVIGLGGNTGRSTGSHLHFETRFLGQAINPALLFDFENQDVTGDSWLYQRKGSKRRGTVAQNSSSDGEIRYYKVRSGDNLSIIARRQGVTINQLCRLNGITRKTVLRPGQILRYS